MADQLPERKARRRGTKPSTFTHGASYESSRPLREALALRLAVYYELPPSLEIPLVLVTGIISLVIVIKWQKNVNSGFNLIMNGLNVGSTG